MTNYVNMSELWEWVRLFCAHPHFSRNDIPIIEEYLQTHADGSGTWSVEEYPDHIRVVNTHPWDYYEGNEVHGLDFAFKYIEKQ